MTKQKPQFDMDAALKALREGKDLTGRDGILTPLIKQLTEAAMQAELESHLDQDEQPNRKNGSTGKTVKSTLGVFELQTPRDRAGTSEPQLVKKHQTCLTDELERKILALFALGMSYQDIRANFEDLYGIAVSNGTLNAIVSFLKYLEYLAFCVARRLHRRTPSSCGKFYFVTRLISGWITIGRVVSVLQIFQQSL